MSARTRPFSQVDVFTDEPTRGNPVAVVFDADDLTDEQMAAFARWTNLSETTFVQTPTGDADYRLRIFTPGGELPFAGHPTLGSAHAWLARGGAAAGETIVQECGIGDVRIRRDDTGLAFAAPPLRRSGPPSSAVREQAIAGLGVDPDAVVDVAWIDNGPPWLGVRVRDGQTVLDLRPDWAAMRGLTVGVVGPWDAAQAARRGADVEVRGFVPDLGVPEDPVTGSLNAGLAVWLRSAGAVPAEYVAAQGTVLGRSGRVRVLDDGDRIWVGGTSVTVIDGVVEL